MSSIKIQYLKTSYGELILGVYDNKLCLLDYRYRKMRSTVDMRIQAGLHASYIIEDSVIHANTRQQLTEYFSGERKAFSIPLLTVGTVFQKSVWQALMEIPYGSTASYLELAKSIGNPSAVRAVASSNGANAISFIIPCHRIIGSDGKLVGYGGGLQAKGKLLLLEQPRLL